MCSAGPRAAERSRRVRREKCPIRVGGKGAARVRGQNCGRKGPESDSEVEEHVEGRAALLNTSSPRRWGTLDRKGHVVRVEPGRGPGGAGLQDWRTWPAST